MPVIDGQVLLREFGERSSGILLDTRTAAWTRVRTDQAAMRPCGLGQQKRLGLDPRRKTLVALYQRSGELFLYIDGHYASLVSKSLITRLWILHPIRLFALQEDAAPIWRTWYFSFEREEYDDFDILRHIHDNLSSEKARRQFAFFWAGVEAGVDVSSKEFQAQLSGLDGSAGR